MNSEEIEESLHKFDDLKREYDKMNRRYNHPSRPISKNEKIFGEYKVDTQDAYNEIVEFNNKYLNRLNEKNKGIIERKLFSIQTKLGTAFELLNIKQKVPNDYFTKIKIETVSENNMNTEPSTSNANNTNKPSTSNTNNTNEQSATKESNTNEKEIIEIENENGEKDKQQSNINTAERENKTKMVSRFEFLQFASQQIKNKFNGDPLQLESFLNSIELVV